METVLHLVSTYGYVAIFCLLMFGIVGLPIPDETLLTFSGYLIYKGHLRFVPALATAFAGSACGITVSYLIGRSGGLFLVHRYGSYARITPGHIQKAHQWFERAGRWGLFFGYFVPGVRHFTALVAGASELDVVSFMLFAYSGAIVWVSTFICLGYFLGERWREISERVHRDVAITAAILAVLLLIAYLLWRRRRAST